MKSSRPRVIGSLVPCSVDALGIQQLEALGGLVIGRSKLDPELVDA